VKQSIILTHEGKNENAVLLFHGLTGAPGELYHLAKRLYDNGFDVYCPVLPGHCRGTEAIKKTGWKEWRSFALNEYDSLKKNYQNVYLTGICLGSVLALSVASERKSVAAVSCLSTTLFLNGWGIPWFSFLLPLVLYTVLKFFYAFPEGGAFGVKNHDAREKVKKSYTKEDSNYLDCFPIICVLEMLRLSRHTRRVMHKVTSPVIIFHSSRDDFTSTKSADVVYRKISSKTKEYIILKNSYHLITLDNEREDVFNGTVDFFKRGAECTR
jgi:carboxylesterase